jgi:hypothetical protein
VNPSLSLIREFYRSLLDRDDLTRNQKVTLAIANARAEMREGERAEAELAEGLYDLASEREGSPEDDYEGELPW